MTLYARYPSPRFHILPTQYTPVATNTNKISDYKWVTKFLIFAALVAFFIVYGVTCEFSGCKSDTPTFSPTPTPTTPTASPTLPTFSPTVSPTEAPTCICDYIAKECTISH